MNIIINNLDEANRKMITHNFSRYVSQNVLAMTGLSFYILVDTFFIAKSTGTFGMAVLNLCLPIYNFIAAIGNMVATGAAILFSIEKSKNSPKKDSYFFNAIFFELIIGIIWLILGICFPDRILYLLGADKSTVGMGIQYLNSIMIFAPATSINYVMNAFVRNDGSPDIAMIGMLAGSLGNMVFDYIFMFIFGLGLRGAGLATGLSPVIGIIICLLHFRRKRNTIKFIPIKPKVRELFYCSKIGISVFIGEMAAGITTFIFNMVIIDLAGNSGVAAYGIIANIALMVIAIYNGIANGVQPLISEKFGQGKKEDQRYLLLLGFMTTFLLSLIMYLLIVLNTKTIVDVFNTDNNPSLYKYSQDGLILYSIGYFFAGANILITGYFSSIKKVFPALFISLIRGLCLISLLVIIFSKMFGMNGVWISYSVTEGITLFIAFIFLYLEKKKN